MKKKLDAIAEAAALIGVDRQDLTEEQAMKILRNLVMSNSDIRIRRARNDKEKRKELFDE
jgi:hypothetical protein